MNPRPLPTNVQRKAALELVPIDPFTFAQSAGVKVSAVYRYLRGETGQDVTELLTLTLERAGISFVDESGGAFGVLMKRK